jgi:Flp pilus assembly protein TadD
MDNKIICAALLVSGCAGTSVVDKSARELEHERKCVAFIAQNDVQRAETNCKLCLDFNERNAECLNNYGLVWYRRSDDDKAREYFRRAIRVNNDHAQARSNMGTIEFEAGDYAAAIPFYESSLEIDPHFKPARVNLARAHMRIGIRDKSKEHLVKAADEYRALIEIDENDPLPWAELGVVATYLDETTEAEKDFLRCLQLAPEHKECHGNLGHLYVALGRYADAVPHLEACIAAATGDNQICVEDLKRARE